MKEVLLVAYGACVGNANTGGWACLLRYKDRDRELVGAELNTSNFRMEIQAVVQGLAALKEPCVVRIKTDSQYVCEGIAHWIHKWKEKGWIHKVKREGWVEVKHRDLWQRLEVLAARHDVRWDCVAESEKDSDDKRCDSLAYAAARAAAATRSHAAGSSKT